MAKNADFLVEIQTEELPPKALLNLAMNFAEEIKNRLTAAKLSFTKTEFFATPRRLAVRVTELASKQADNINERRGPAWAAAFDAAGKPTPACEGFARSCGVVPSQLITIENNQGKWVGYKQIISGKTVQTLMPEIIQQSLAALPIPKRMRWGNNNNEFIRPVHSVILLYGTKVIPATIIGCKAGQITVGHRFLCKKPLKISSPKEYEKVLEKTGYVIANFEKRKNIITKQAQAIIKRSLGSKAHILLENKLLDEVTGLVEWPVAILGKFDKDFLKVPQEALISAMQDHQRYFPVMDKNNQLLAYFVSIINLKSRKVKQVVEGNERVLRARLSDAAFFFEVDKKIKLKDRLPKLKEMVFQAKLGTLYDKAERIAKLAFTIASDIPQAKQAGLLAKADLTTELVGEFPELQGIAGYYYALNDHENKEIAIAIKEHYQPRFSGDALPTTKLGCAVALADRIDTLAGIFSIGLLPTGDKDPFGLRRAAISILRILIEKEMNIDLGKLLQQALMLYPTLKPDQSTANNLWNFIVDRLQPLYQEQGIGIDVIRSILSAVNNQNPYDIHRRIKALQIFKKLPQSEALSIANKRVSNILTQYNKPIQRHNIDMNLFEHDAEHALAKSLQQYEQQLASLVASEKYQEALTTLAKLREPVDAFFDHVMVMVDDQQKRENRLLMLKKLRGMFLQVADIALLQS
jgi:glycyl-tRNA synthetase beta chain